MLYEVAIHKQASAHQNVVTMRSALLRDTPRQMWIVMDLVNGVTAERLREASQFSNGHCAHIVASVLRALVYLHFSNIAHRDIKGGNVLVSTEGDVQLVDFGLACRLSKVRPRRKSVVGTPTMMAPEMLSRQTYDCAVDVWALGMLTLRLADSFPFASGQTPSRIERALRKKHPRLKSNSRLYSPELAAFVDALLERDAGARPTAAVALQHRGISFHIFEKDSLHVHLHYVIGQQHKFTEDIGVLKVLLKEQLEQGWLQFHTHKHDDSGPERISLSQRSRRATYGFQICSPK